MTTEEVAEHLGGIAPNGARKWLKRQGIEPAGRQPGAGGLNLYSRAEVTSTEGLGRGYRSDLHRPADEASRDADS